MTNEDTGQKGLKRHESDQLAETSPVTDEHKERAKEMAQSSVEKRPTTVLPGTKGTVAGTAVND